MRNNDIVTGLGFGDEGKGTIVDYLTSRTPTKYVIRFSGGPQAAHNVTLPDGRNHTFAQFGSGTFNGAGTILSKHMMVNPFSMVPEAEHIQTITNKNPFLNTYISENSLLVTPYHQTANQLREIQRGQNPHGSCGLGIGETTAYSLTHPEEAPRIKDLLNLPELHRKLNQLRNHFTESFPSFTVQTPKTDDIINAYQDFLEDIPFNIITDEEINGKLHEGYNVFEGSQGVLLDENYGFHPHTTWSTVTAENAQNLLQNAGLQPGRVIGVTRTYSTRHGHGPFPSEHQTNMEETYPENHNKEGRFQGSWRTGDFDLPLFLYALKVNPVDVLAITHLDRKNEVIVTEHDNFSSKNGEELKGLEGRTAKRNYQSKITDLLFVAGNKSFTVPEDFNFIEFLQKETKMKVAITSYGPTREDKISLL